MVLSARTIMLRASLLMPQNDNDSDCKYLLLEKMVENV